MWCDRELMNICCRNRLCRGLYYIVGKIATMAKNIYQGKCMLKKTMSQISNCYKISKQKRDHKII